MLDLERLRGLCSSPDSAISSVSCSIHLALQPSCLADVKAGVVHLLNTKVNQYYPELKGILMGFEKIKMKSREGVLFNDNPFIHIDISSKFYVFRPVSGSLLRGRVNKKSPGHVGCLVHDTFNAAIIAPRGEDLARWCGRNAQLGKQMIFTTTAVMFSGALPSILGTITETGVNAVEEQQQQITLDYDSGFGSTSKKKVGQSQDGDQLQKRTKKIKVEELEESEQLKIKLEEQDDGNCDTTKNVKKKKKKHKRKLEELEDGKQLKIKLEEQEDGNCDNEKNVKKKKKEKKHKKQLEELEDGEQLKIGTKKIKLEVLEDSDCDTTKNMKKKKKHKNKT